MGSNNQTCQTLAMHSNIVLVGLALCVLIGSAVSTFEHCGECTKLHLTSQGSFAEDYSRFIGTWVKVSTYMDLPMYQCMDCGGLTQHLIFYRPDLDYHPQVGRWAVTDCNPHHEHSCAGVHAYVENQDEGVAGDGSCPWNLKQPWEYCTGTLTVQGGCTQYTTDATIKFSCAD